MSIADEVEAHERNAVLKLRGKSSLTLHSTVQAPPTLGTHPYGLVSLFIVPTHACWEGTIRAFPNSPKTNAIRLLQVPIRSLPTPHAKCAGRTRERLQRKVVLACLLHDISVFGLLIPNTGIGGRS